MNDNFCRMVADALTEQDAKEERRKLRPWVGAVVSGACLAALFVLATSAYAVPMLKSSDGSVALKLKDTPCSDEKVLFFLAQKVQPEFLGKFKDSVLTYGGREWKSCWIEHQGHIFSIDEEGAPMQPIPLQYFRENSI